MTRTLTSMCCILLTISFAAAESPWDLVGEITKRPHQKAGQWVIAGKTLVADRDSDFSDFEHAVKGNLVAVEYKKRGSTYYIRELEATPLDASSVNDGPHVLWRDDQTIEVLSIQNGAVSRQVIPGVVKKTIVKSQSPVPAIMVDPALPQPSQSRWETPSRLLAISDMEGNYDRTLRFLQNNHVIDDQGHWIWGDGHLVLLGDLVDRGDGVTEVLWLIRRLEREARVAGGQVHLVIGNHEAMVMAGDLRYTHPKYFYAAKLYGKDYEDLYGERSEMGRWLRSKNAVVQVGELLFVHGGYSPTLNELGLSLTEINVALRSQLGRRKMDDSTLQKDLAWHRQGPLWYRGYFKKYDQKYGGLPTAGQMERILSRHGVKHIVVGHTVVPQLGPLDETGAVIAIDTRWVTADRCRGLLQSDGRLYNATITGHRTEVPLAASR